MDCGTPECLWGKYCRLRNMRSERMSWDSFVTDGASHKVYMTSRRILRRELRPNFYSDVLGDKREQKYAHWASKVHMGVVDEQIS